MKFRSRKAKPETGMELSVTLSMAASLPPDDAALRIIQFFESVNAARHAGYSTAKNQG